MVFLDHKHLGRIHLHVWLRHDDSAGKKRSNRYVPMNIHPPVSDAKSHPFSFPRFVQPSPVQLFINYKLKSVAHLNWRTLTYKSLNTFVDDLFAFVIKMPLMHRLACLRDDFVFFIFLYQRHAYKVDYTRVNEYGQCEQPEEGGDEKKAILEVAKEDDATASTRDANAGTERTDTDDFRKPRRDKRAPIE
mmetsp:Transcript_29063/g.66588  ORF Transcript_29063/g.66588 Transcript_29063/m.66588 type:complete len:190 (-) Transcript_29063:93-662(-)